MNGAKRTRGERIPGVVWRGHRTHKEEPIVVAISLEKFCGFTRTASRGMQDGKVVRGRFSCVPGEEVPRWGCGRCSRAASPRRRDCWTTRAGGLLSITEKRSITVAGFEDSGCAAQERKVSGEQDAGGKTSNQ